MATRERLEQALRNAHAAGDTEAARRLAAAIRNGEYEQPQQQMQNQERPGIFENLRQGNISGALNEYGQKAIGIADAGLGVLSGAVAEPLAGLAGIGSAVGTLDSGKASNTVSAVRDALSYQPRSERGQEYIQNVGQALEPVANALQSAEQGLGDAAYSATGSPTMAAAATALPTLASELIGTRLIRSGARAGDAVRDIKNAAPAPEAQQILDASNRFEIPVLNSDVNPPTTFPGRMAQSLSEKMGPLGSGTARASQQKARMDAVEDLAKEFNVELSSPFAEQMVSSLNRRNAERLSKAAESRNSAVSALDQHGVVPVTKTITAIDRQLARQARLGERADQSIVNRLESTKEAIQNGDFSLVKDIRTEVIDDVKALSRSEDSRGMAAMQSVKSAIDDDLLDFAKAKDRRAAADWVRSNREYSEAFSIARDSELKRVLNRGEATPETVLPILRNGKMSELRRLKTSLTPEGVSAARAAIIRDVLDESGFFRGDVNPDRVAASLGKSNRMKAVDIFFDERGKKELDGLRKLLDATRRAQSSSIAPPTGVQTIPFLASGAIGGSAVSFGPIPTMAAVGTLSGIAKAYESKPMRNLLLKIGNTTPGTRTETMLLESAIPAFLAELQAAKEQQEQNQQ